MVAHYRHAGRRTMFRRVPTHPPAELNTHTKHRRKPLPNDCLIKRSTDVPPMNAAIRAQLLVRQTAASKTPQQPVALSITNGLTRGEKLLDNLGGTQDLKNEREPPLLACKAPLDVEVLADELEQGRRSPAGGALHVLSSQSFSNNKISRQKNKRNETRRRRSVEDPNANHREGSWGSHIR